MGIAFKPRKAFTVEFMRCVPAFSDLDDAAVVIDKAAPILATAIYRNVLPFPEMA